MPADKPQPEHYPVSPSWIGRQGGGVIAGTIELYLPEVFSRLSCVVHKYNFQILSFRRMNISVEFRISGDSSVIKSLYEGEEWKFETIRAALENENASEPKNSPSPIFSLMLCQFLQISSASLKVDSREVPVIVDQGVDFIALPPSRPPLTGLPENETYVFFDKKSAVFYADLVLDKTYRLDIELETSGLFEHAPLFPFSKVKIESVECDGNELEIGCAYAYVYPEKKKSLPTWLEEKLKRLGDIGNRRPPKLRPADPARGDLPLFSLKAEDHQLLVNSSLIKSSLSDYQALRFAPLILIPENKNIDIDVRVANRPIAPRIYEQMQGLPHYRDFLVEYDILNLTKKKLRVRVETEIHGFTEKEKKVYFIRGLENKAGKPARERIIQCPRLKRGILNTITGQERAVMSCVVVDEDSKEEIFNESFNLDILPHDQAILDIKDIRNNHRYDLGNFIGAWIYVSDQEGVIDKVRSEAVDFFEGSGYGCHSGRTYAFAK